MPWRVLYLDNCKKHPEGNEAKSPIFTMQKFIFDEFADVVLAAVLFVNVMLWILQETSF